MFESNLTPILFLHHRDSVLNQAIGGRRVLWQSVTECTDAAYFTGQKYRASLCFSSLSATSNDPFIT